MKPYRSFSCGTQGAKHIKENLVCQDAVLHFDDERMSVAIVADGHGSPQYFRSDKGSRFATEVALEGIKGFIAQTNPEKFINDGGEKLLGWLAKNIIAAWYAKVDDDEKVNPFTDDEKLNSLEDKEKSKYLNDPDRQHLYRAYGTTLIAVAITDDYWFGLHIGDGKCIVLFDDGSWGLPIPWDDKCFLNSTTSLCDDDAIARFRSWCGIASKDKRKPIAMFVGSDGVDDTYPVHENEKHLERLYRSIVLSFAKEGYESTLTAMDTLIQKLTAQGSGDDVSIAGIIGDIAPSLVAELSVRDEADKVVIKAMEEQKKAVAKLQEANNAVTKAVEKQQKAMTTIQEARMDIERYKNDQKQAGDVLRDLNRSIEKTKKEQKRAHDRLQDAERGVSKAMNERQKALGLFQDANNIAQQAEERQKATAAKLEDVKKGIDKATEEQRAAFDSLQDVDMAVAQTKAGQKEASARLQEADRAVTKAIEEQQKVLAKRYDGADSCAPWKVGG